MLYPLLHDTTVQVHRVTPPSVEYFSPLPFATGQLSVWSVNTHTLATLVYPASHETTIQVHRVTHPSVEYCSPLPLATLQDWVWSLSTHISPIWVYPDPQLVETIVSVPVDKVPSSQVKVCSQVWLPPVIVTSLCSVLDDPPLVTGTSYPSRVVAGQLRLHIPPVRVESVVQDAVGEVQIVVFPAWSLIVTLQVPSGAATIQVPHPVAIQLSPSVLPVRVNSRVPVNAPLLGVQVPHTGAVLSIIITSAFELPVFP